MSAALPKRLGRYEIQEEIGRGMMGVVYRAVDPALGRTVALKTVHLAWAISDDDRKSFEKRFMAEARVSAGLSHPGIVVIHDIGQDAEAKTVFIAMEFLQGRTLADLAGDGPMPWREALRLAARVAEALHHAHAAGVVHRDIKPANIMILPSGDPKIMDFGIAKVPASQITSVGEFFGTPSYMSPEQASGAAVDGRSDLFSLGSVLYMLLTGRRAFDAANVPAILARVASQDPPPPSRIVPGLPGDVDYLVTRALAKDPGDRYHDGNTFAEDLTDVREGRAPRNRAGWKTPPRAEGTLAPVATTPEPETADLWHGAVTPSRRVPVPARRWGRGRWAYFAGGVLVAVALAMLLLHTRGGGLPTAPSINPSPAPDRKAEARPSATPESPASLLLPFPMTLPPAAAPSPTPPPPAHLEVTLTHPLKSGTLRVWIDETLVLEKPLGSAVTKKMLVIKSRKGTLREVVDVAPGDHAVRLRILGDGFDETRRHRRTFKSGETEHLELDVGGVILRDLIEEWSH